MYLKRHGIKVHLVTPRIRVHQGIWVRNVRRVYSSQRDCILAEHCLRCGEKGQCRGIWPMSPSSMYSAPYEMTPSIIFSGNSPLPFASKNSMRKVPIPISLLLSIRGQRKNRPPKEPVPIFQEQRNCLKKHSTLVT